VANANKENLVTLLHPHIFDPPLYKEKKHIWLYLDVTAQKSEIIRVRALIMFIFFRLRFLGTNNEISYPFFCFFFTF